MFKRAVLLVAVAASLVIAPAPAGMASAPAAARGILDLHLTVEPTYDGLALLTTDSLEWSDSLPEYSFSLIEHATGRAVGLKYGYASTLDDLESDYAITTAEPLVIGTVYDAAFSVHTSGFWHCSIYDEDGCTWYKPATQTGHWSFSYSGSKIQATSQSPAPPAPTYSSKSKFVLGPRQKWGAHGWKIRVTLVRKGGTPVARTQIDGALRRSAGGWHYDKTWRTDSHGRVKLTFAGETQPTMYRFEFDGSGVAGPSTSKSFSIARRA